MNAQVLHLASMYADPTFYFDYFSGLLMTAAGGPVDRGPDAGVRDAPGRADDQIKEGFADRGVRTVSAFLMRDPVDRMLSHLRMQIRGSADAGRAAARGGAAPAPRHPEYALRTGYDHTITALDEAFDPSEVYYRLLRGPLLRAPGP